MISMTAALGHLALVFAAIVGQVALIGVTHGPLLDRCDGARSPDDPLGWLIAVACWAGPLVVGVRLRARIPLGWTALVGLLHAVVAVWLLVPAGTC